MSSFHKPTQIELFPSPEDKPAPHRFGGPLFICRLTLSLENIVILTIGVIILMVVSFSLGIEKGKHFVRVPVTPAAVVPGAPVPAVPAGDSVVPEAPVPDLVAEVPVAQQEPVISAPEGGEKKDVDKFYTVQVASFQQEKFARKEAMELKDSGYETLIIPKGKHSIVCVGKFTVREEAKVVSKELRKKYKDCLIRRL